MTLSWDRAAAMQADFMERLADRLEECRDFLVPESGEVVSGRARRDRKLPPDYTRETDRILKAEGIFDPGVRDRLPRGARTLWEVRKASLLGGSTALVVLGCVVHPVVDLARGLSPRPRDAEGASDLLPASAEDVPAVVAALSTSGWRGEAGDLATVFLFEPADGGGYRRYGGGDEVSPPWLALETEAELRARVVGYVERSRAELVLRGLSARAASVRLGVPAELVGEVLTGLAESGEFLRISREDGDVVLRRA